MNFRVEELAEKKLIGFNAKMSFAQNTTAQLWQKFMIEKNKIFSGEQIDLYSVQVYPPDFFTQFNPLQSFEKWATAESFNFETVPEEMHQLIIPEGLYAVFNYRGNPNHAQAFFQNIFQTWLPASPYVLDNRPHFEVIGSKYKNNDASSEEEIWIPIKKHNIQ